MPLVAWGVAAYAAGLVGGFGGAFVWAFAGSVALLLWALLRPGRGAPSPFGGPWGAAAIAVALAGGGVLGDRSRAHDRRCAEAVRRSGTALARLTTPWDSGAVRGIVVGVTRDERCRLAIRARSRVAPAAGLHAGSLVQLRGAFAYRGRQLDLREATVTARGAPPLLWRWRTRTGAQIDTLYGADAPLARALLLADAGDIDRAVRDRFADAGIIHMLSVSGLHVGIIAGAVQRLALVARAGALAAETIALGVTAAFVLFIGAPPPAVRSAAMLALVVAARLRQRPTSLWGIWAVSSAVPLVEPRVVLDLGWQLSVVGMAGLLASARPVVRLTRRLRGWRRTVVASMVATTVASAVTAPLVAWVFGRVSLAAIATNAVAAPMFEIAQPLLFASIVALPLDWLARWLAEAARTALGGIDLVARLGASLPFAAVRAEPDVVSAVLLGGAALACVVALAGRWRRRPMAIALGALASATWWPLLRPGPGRVELHVLDVGQGDALALRTPRGRWLLVDAGGAWRGGDAGGTIVWPYLRRLGGDVVYLAVTHPHLDHLGGAATLLSRAGVDTVWDGAYVAPGAAYRSLLQAARRHRWQRVAAGDSLSFDGVQIRVLAPDSAWMASLDDPNEASVVLHVQYGAVRFLLTGDAESAEEGWLVARHGEALRSDVLKVGHHGSATSSTPPFLDAVRPRLAVVSVGAGNRYGHPSQDVLQALDARGAHLLRTDDEGTIVISTDGQTIDWRTMQRPWRVRLPIR